MSLSSKPERCVILSSVVTLIRWSTTSSREWLNLKIPGRRFKPKAPSSRQMPLLHYRLQTFYPFYRLQPSQFSELGRWDEMKIISYSTLHFPAPSPPKKAFKASHENGLSFTDTVFPFYAVWRASPTPTWDALSWFYLCYSVLLATQHPPGTRSRKFLALRYYSKLLDLEILSRSSGQEFWNRVEKRHRKSNVYC